MFGMDHNSSHFFKGTFLPFNNLVLLRCDEGRELVGNPFNNAKNGEVKFLKYFDMIASKESDLDNHLSLFTL